MAGKLKDTQGHAMKEIGTGLIRLCVFHDAGNDVDGFNASVTDACDAITSNLGEVLNEKGKVAFVESMILQLFDEQLVRERKHDLLQRLHDIARSY